MAKTMTKQMEPAAAASGNKLLLLVVALVAVALVAAGGVAWAAMKAHAANDDDGDGQAKRPETAAHRPTPVFVPLEVFTVKLQADAAGQEQYLQLVPALRALDLPAGEKIKAYLPQIRHDMLSLMSTRKPSELSSPQGIEKLAIDLRNRVNQPLLDARAPAPAGEKPGADDPVQAVLFSAFIIQ